MSYQRKTCPTCRSKEIAPVIIYKTVDGKPVVTGSLMVCDACDHSWDRHDVASTKVSGT